MKNSADGRRSNLPFARALAAAACLALAPVGTRADSPAATAPPAPIVVHVKNFAYDPTPLEIHAGDVVTFVNDDEVAHTVTATDRSFDSGELGANRSWQHAFAMAGRFSYYCSAHPYMKATVVVLPPGDKAPANPNTRLGLGLGTPGRRLESRREDAERRALVRLTAAYLGVFAAVIVAISTVAYAFVDDSYRSIVAPALETPEGRAGFAAAMRPALYAIVSIDAILLLGVGIASYALARAALRPLSDAREREERFASDAAHELRTPLAAIASLAQSAEPAANVQSQIAFAAIARRALECGQLVGDLLTLARAGDVNALHREPVAFAEVVRQVVRDCRVPDGIAVEGRYDDAVVFGDERRLRQLVRNLLENAVAHAASRVTLALECDGGDARLSVEDDGPGVPADLAPRLFERFAKEPSSAGSGLGLAICRWVARAHGGDVAFAGGSRFIARIPLRAGI